MTRQQIAIIDYGMGNLHSVASALTHVEPNADIIVTSDRTAIANADRVVFPGVGAIRDCVSEIRRLGFDRTVEDVIASGKPILGICVGMQALMTSSEENGGADCLNCIDGTVDFFSNNAQFTNASHIGPKLKVPHMGWNQVKQTQEHGMWHDIDDNGRFYFVHSYFVRPTNTALQVGEAHYGIPFTAAIARDNMFAVQFHPEKSHHNGLKLLSNFVTWDGKAG